MPDVPWLVLLWPLLMLGVIVVAAVYKYMEVNSAKSWRSAPGVVIRSDVQTRNVKLMSDIQRADGSGATEARNFANVVYEYELFGKKLRNNRVSIGEDLGNFEVEETLARYPVGTRVTVYYNPRNPKQAVLERDAPKGMWGCITTGVLGLAAAYLIAVFGFTKIYDALTSIWTPANATRAVLFSLRSVHRDDSGSRPPRSRRRAILARGARARREIRGRTVSGLCEQRQGRVEHDQDILQVGASDSYTVNGRTYTGSQYRPEGHGHRKLGRPCASRRRTLQGRADGRCALRSQKPTEAALETGYPLWFWFSWIIPDCAFAAAIYFGT